MKRKNYTPISKLTDDQLGNLTIDELKNRELYEDGYRLFKSKVYLNIMIILCIVFATYTCIVGTTLGTILYHMVTSVILSIGLLRSYSNYDISNELCKLTLLFHKSMIK